ncbi:MAG: ChbG/HpnK family deacetylase [Oscillospiraceae bacterium]|nr:ChbG/HpnK family deacetylase [Oscillospiraceae bacterium]
MLYFCADDYGISEGANSRIENCMEYGVLNQISVLPNGTFRELKERFSEKNVRLSLHLNLVEGRPLSDPKEIGLLVSEDGEFRDSFVGLFFRALLPGRRALEKQIYRELQSQLRFWKQMMGANTPLLVDSHQHTHMIPLVFRTLLRVIEDEQMNVQTIRIPAEPLSPYLLTPSLYLEYSPVGLVKQWLLKACAAINRKELKKTKIRPAYFMGVLFSGNVNEKRIRKLLPKYLRLAEKHNKDVEIGLHPGYMEDGEEMIEGCRAGFKKFYFSPGRKIEYDALMHLKP